MFTPFSRKTVVSVITGFLLAGAAPLPAQWLDRQTAGIPRNQDGSPNLSAPAPRKADGTPDLSGIWMVPGLKYLINIAADLKDVPFQPWAAAEYKRRVDTRGKDDPNNFCLPSIIPEKIAVTSPWKIVETPGLTLILYESRTIFRQIFTDGRALPKDPNPTWMGYSVGHWEGDTMVVESNGFNGKAWMSFEGIPITDALHLTERMRRRDFGHMDIQLTIDDPKAYTRPWTTELHPELAVDTELIEFVCDENEKDVRHLVGK